MTKRCAVCAVFLGQGDFLGFSEFLMLLRLSKLVKPVPDLSGTSPGGLRSVVCVRISPGIFLAYP